MGFMQRRPAAVDATITAAVEVASMANVVLGCDDCENRREFQTVGKTVLLATYIVARQGEEMPSAIVETLSTHTTISVNDSNVSETNDRMLGANLTTMPRPRDDSMLRSEQCREQCAYADKIAEVAVALTTRLEETGAEVTEV